MNCSLKLWKRHARIDDWRTANPAQVLCEIYAKLIGLVFQQWLLAASSWHDLERSLFKAAPIIAGMAGELASTQADPLQFLQVLTWLAVLIQHWAATNKAINHQRSSSVYGHAQHHEPKLDTHREFTFKPQ